MPRLNPEQVGKRSENAWKVKNLWRDLKSSAYELALPMRNLYHGSAGSTGHGKQQPGARKQTNVYDSTLMISTIRSANRLQTDLTPPFQNWAKIVPGSFIPEGQRDDLQKRLDPINETLFGAIHVSNFDTQINEFYLDLMVGTACMMVMEGDDDEPVRYVTVPQAQVALEEGPWGGISGVFRQHSIKIRNIEGTWKDFDLNLPDDFEKRKKDNPEEDIHVIEATYFDVDEDQWYYDVLWKTAKASHSKQTMHRLVEHEFDESPWVITRWIKVAGEVEGRGPVLFALPDAKTLNKLKELVLMNASIAIAGVWTAVDDGILNPNTVRIRPGAVIPVGRNGGALGASLAPLQSGADFNVSSIIAEELTNSIKQIMLDVSLPPEAGPVRSATEIVERIKMLQQDIGAPFGRLMSELIRPLVQKTLNVLARRKILNIEGGGKIKVNGGLIDVSIQSPLAQVQNLSEVQTAMQWFSMVQAIGPEATMLGVNIEDMPEWLGQKMGVAQKLMRTQEQRQQAQQMIAALNAQQQQGPQAQAANSNAAAQPAGPPQQIAA